MILLLSTIAKRWSQCTNIDKNKADAKIASALFLSIIFVTRYDGQALLFLISRPALPQINQNVGGLFFAGQSIQVEDDASCPTQSIFVYQSTLPW